MLSNLGDLLDLNQRAESNDIGDELGLAAFVSIDSMENEETLEFVKSSRLWKNIYSMKTYKMMTLKPHFHPLNEHINGTYLGSAIGHGKN